MVNLFDFSPSTEQHKIINNIEHNNISVNAVPGSGTTTTALGISKKYPLNIILIVTFNSQLKEDTRQNV